eukprot:gene2910-3723_t
MSGNSTLSVISTADEDGPVKLTWLSICFALVVIALAMALSLRLQLKLESSLLISALRAILQLSLLGYILVPIFQLNSVYLVLLYCSFMICVSASEAVSKQKYHYKGMAAHTLFTVASSSSLVIVYGLYVVLRTDPMWDAHYVIPILGMLLGNSLTSVSVAYSCFLEEVAERHDNIEFLLSRGATRWEAVRHIVQRAVKLGTTPLINQMSVAGLVSIPGMMTGQILGGTSPLQAARYQMVVLFMLGGCASLSAYMILVLASNKLVDAQLCLRVDLLHKKTKYAGVFSMLFTWLSTGVSRSLSQLRTRLEAVSPGLEVEQESLLSEAVGPLRA